MTKHNAKPTSQSTREVVRCPGCKRPQPKRGGHSVIYWCEHCRCQFDDAPDEGSDYDDRNPARRLEREERWNQQRKENRRAKA